MRQRQPVGPLVVVELGQQQPPQRLRHPRIHLEPHDLGESPVADFLLDHRQQVVGLVGVDLEIGVPGDPERVGPQDLDAGKQRFEIGRDDQLERHVPVGPGSGTHRARIFGTLTPGKPLLAVVAPEHHRQRQGEVGDVGERVGRIHRQRGQHREDVGRERLLDVVDVFLGELLERR